jgi:metal-responsive CopG/Arc/MetJ family transcriptional regulator
MPAKPVQISMDANLLQRIDKDPEAREKGRSAFLRSAASFYLAAKRRRAVDDAIARAYEGQADVMLDEVAELMGSQAWPEK